MFGPKIAHLDLIEYVIVDLLRVKWKSFVQRSFYRQFFMFSLYFLMSAFCFVSRTSMPTKAAWACNITQANTTADNTGNIFDNIAASLDNFRGTLKDNLEKGSGFEIEPGSGFGIEAGSGMGPMEEVNPNNPPVVNLGANEKMEMANMMNKAAAHNMENENGEDDEEGGEEEQEEELCDIPKDRLDHCYLIRYSGWVSKVILLLLFCVKMSSAGQLVTPCRVQVRGAQEAILVIWSIIYIINAVREFRFLGRVIFMENMVLCPSRVGFLIACSIVPVMAVLRPTCVHQVEDRLAIIVMLLTGFHFLFYCRGFKLVSSILSGNQLFDPICPSLSREFKSMVRFI